MPRAVLATTDAAEEQSPRFPNSIRLSERVFTQHGEAGVVRMKRKIAKLAILGVGVAVGSILVSLAVVPLHGAWWHLLHGNAISFQDWTIPVPKGFYVTKSSYGTMMWRTTFGIPFFDVPYGLISLFLRPPRQPFSYERDHAQFKDSLVRDASGRGTNLRQSALLRQAGSVLIAWSLRGRRDERRGPY